MSNVEIMKTKAELSFAERFAAVVEQLPGNAGRLDTRQAAMARFEELGLPHRRIEAWKYTDLRSVMSEVGQPAVGEAITLSEADVDAALGDFGKLDAYRAVFVNGRLEDGLSRLPQQEGVTIGQVEGAAITDDNLNAEAIVALNTAFVTDGLALHVADGVTLDKPLIVASLRAGGGELLVTLRQEIVVGAGASVTVVELAGSHDQTGGQSNALSCATIAEGGQLEHIKLGAGPAITDLATWRARLGKDASYRAVQVIPGAPLARNQVFITFNGEGGELDFASAALGNGTNHIDSTIVVDHRAPGCTSRELFKGVLDDRARGVCQGKVIVQREAQKTDGKQMAQALMLSEDCEFDSKPELEIYADDVACGHGSTSAEIDPDLVFYCRSRGIPEDQAKVLLTESFVAEVMDKIDHDELRDAVVEVARQWLAANHASK